MTILNKRSVGLDKLTVSDESQKAIRVAVFR